MSSNTNCRSESQEDELLCAITTCLFATLHLGTTSEILDQALNLATRIDNDSTSTQVSVALFEAADKCVRDVVSKVKIDAPEENVRDISLSNPIGAGAKIFLHHLALALFEADSSRQRSANAASIEGVRIARARLALTIMSQGKLVDDAVRGQIYKILSHWKSHETSMHVREILDQATSTTT